MVQSEGEESAKKLFEQITDFMVLIEEKLMQGEGEIPEGTMEQLQTMLEQSRTLRENDRKIREMMGIDEPGFQAKLKKTIDEARGTEKRLYDKIERLKDEMAEKETQIIRELKAADKKQPLPQKKKGSKSKGQKGTFRRSVGDEKWKKL